MSSGVDRRVATRLLVAAAGGMVMGLPAQAFGQAPRYFDWRACGAGHVGVGAGGNVLLWPTPFGAVLVDTKIDALGRTVRREAESVAGRLAAVIITHHHSDHAGGIPAFSGDLPVHSHSRGVGRRVVAGRALKERFADGVPDSMESMFADVPQRVAAAVRADIQAYARAVGRRDVQSFAANVTFKFEDELDAGDDVIQLRYSGRAHTDNDAWVRIPGANVLHTGDLVFNGSHPFIDVDSGATTLGWQRSLSEILSSCDADTIVVPGHGEVTDIEGVRVQWEYFERLRDAVQAGIEEGRSRDEVVASVPEFFAQLPERRAAENLEIVFDELGG
jgi:glyoxylase-like metal-dependent hydrolase (beta-lactamase superfamily II)